MPKKFWSGIPDSNWRPSAWQADALPTELIPHQLGMKNISSDSSFAKTRPIVQRGFRLQSSQF